MAQVSEVAKATEETEATEVIVVGAGIVGLSTAWTLAKRGYDVVVYDPDPVSEASFAAAGMLAPVSEVVWDQPNLYPLMRRSGEMYAGLAAEVAEESGMDVGYLPSETLVCAGDTADRGYLTELLDLQAEVGEVQTLSVREARALEPALGPGVVAAVRIPGDHQIDPRKYCKAMLSLLEDRVKRERVEAVLFDDAGHTSGVRLSSGAERKADTVVLACGLHVNEIEGVPVQLPLRPVYGDVLRLRVPEHAQPLLSRTVRAIVRSRPVYLVPRSDGTLVLGATSREDTQTGVSAEGAHQLLRDAHHIVPGIWDCAIEEMTARARPGSPDDVPMIGTLAPGLVVSTGYFRHGILLSALGAELTADIVVGKPLDTETAAAVDPFRFSSLPSAALEAEGDDHGK